MIPCNKRQKVVNRAAGLTEFRCLNRRCGLHGQSVDEGICSRCPVRSEKHKRPCTKLTAGTSDPAPMPPVTDQEMIDVTDPEVMEMIADAGLDTRALEKRPDGTYPPMTVQMWTYKEAVIKWKKAGRPKRSQEEVERLHSTFCAAPCEWYDAKWGRCKGCGCAVSVGSWAVFNKLKMSTEHCPLEKF